MADNKGGRMWSVRVGQGRTAGRAWLLRSRGRVRERRQVCAAGEHMGMSVRQGVREAREGTLQQRRGLGVAGHREVEHGQIVSREGDLDVVGLEQLLFERQDLPVQGFRLGQASLRLADGG